MKSLNHWISRQIAVMLMFLLAFPASEAGLARAQASQGGSQAAKSAPGIGTGTDNAQSALNANSNGALPEAPAPASPEGPNAGQQTASPQPGGGQSQEIPHKPVGAAAAPYEPTMGIAASRPAGAAIAPAKQRRVRTIVISLGVIAGVGIAVGSVAALSHGSPSRP
jgi:hypothetical protein